MKSVTLYLVLVGIPVLGLLGILRIGETLDVPVSIGGVWIVDAATANALSRSCAPLAFPDGDQSITISQSGTHAQVRFSDAERTTMVGRLYAGTLSVRQVLPAARHVRHICGAGTIVLLQMRLQRASGESDRLRGSWRTPECAECPLVAFGATRLPAR